jgi:hypothetical protein
VKHEDVKHEDMKLEEGGRAQWALAAAEGKASVAPSSYPLFEVAQIDKLRHSPTTLGR